MNDRIASFLSEQSDKPILVTSHRDPDGDCLGSTVAMSAALSGLGLHVDALNRDILPERFAFLDPNRRIHTLEALPARDHRIAVVMDASDLMRLGYDLKATFPELETVINIDHHRSNERFGDLNRVDETASANCEILYDVFEEMDVPWTPEIANALYTGITTDTGSFKYEATTSRTLRIAADLIDRGADINLIRAHVWENEPHNRIQALSDVLDKLRITKDGKLAWVKISQDEILRHKLNNGDLEAFVDYPRTISGVEVALFFKEIEPELLKVSVRTKSCVDATRIAALFGGGGHKRAAGFKVNGRLEQCEEEIIRTVKEEIDREYRCMDS